MTRVPSAAGGEVQLDICVFSSNAERCEITGREITRAPNGCLGCFGSPSRISRPSMKHETASWGYLTRQVQASLYVLLDLGRRAVEMSELVVLSLPRGFGVSHVSTMLLCFCNLVAISHDGQNESAVLRREYKVGYSPLSMSYLCSLHGSRLDCRYKGEVLRFHHRQGAVEEVAVGGGRYGRPERETCQKCLAMKERLLLGLDSPYAVHLTRSVAAVWDFTRTNLF